MINYNLSGKVALITGGGKGLGRSLVENFVEQGCKVVFGNRNEENGRKVSEATGADFVKLDITDLESVKNFVKFAYDKYGRIDILVNNAANVCAQKMNMLDFDEDYIEDVFLTNDYGTFLCMREAMRIMLTQERDSIGLRGSIVNISSITSQRQGHGVSPYAASKAAINSLTGTAALEYGKEGIRVNAVMSGVIDTEQARAFREISPEHFAAYTKTIPLQRIADPSELSKVALWLCSEDASYVLGQSVVADGGTYL